MMTWNRQDYIDTAVARGMDPDQAAELADALMREHERMREGQPGWQRLCMEAPDVVIARYGSLFNSAVLTHPTSSVAAQIGSGNSAVFGYGVMVGMLLAEHGILPSQAEREAAEKNLTEIFAWIEALRAEAKEETS